MKTFWDLPIRCELDREISVHGLIMIRTIKTFLLSMLLVTGVTHASKISEVALLELEREGLIAIPGFEGHGEHQDWVWIEGSLLSAAITISLKNKSILGLMCFSSVKGCLVMYTEYGSCVIGNKYPISIKTENEEKNLLFGCYSSEQGVSSYIVKPELIEEQLYLGTTVSIYTGRNSKQSTPVYLSLSGSVRAMRTVSDRFNKYLRNL